MSDESRSDSLATALHRKKLFDEYFSFWWAEAPSSSQRLAWLTERGVKTSTGAIHRLHRSPESAVWRKAEAARAAEALGQMLSPETDEIMTKCLKEQRFNAVMRELSHEQLMDHLKVENDTLKAQLAGRAEDRKERELALTREKFEVECCEKLLVLVNDKRAREIAESTSLSNTEKITQLRQTYFADVDAMQKTGAVKLPD